MCFFSEHKRQKNNNRITDIAEGFEKTEESKESRKDRYLTVAMDGTEFMRKSYYT